MRKKATMQLSILVGTIAVLCSVLLYGTAVNSVLDTKQNLLRFKGQYKSEAALDLSAALFVNYIDENVLPITYSRTEDGFQIIGNLSPYIFNPENGFSLPVISAECAAYLRSTGFPDIKAEDITVKIETGSDDNLRIGNLVKDYDFLTAPSACVAVLPDIPLEMSCRYGHGAIRQKLNVSGIKIQRSAFDEGLEVGMTDTVYAEIDCSAVEIKITDYQNYGGGSNA